MLQRKFFSCVDVQRLAPTSSDKTTSETCRHLFLLLILIIYCVERISSAACLEHVARSPLFS